MREPGGGLSGYAKFAVTKYAGNVGSLGFFSVRFTKKIEADANPF
jgi:hypothetical protein